MSADMPSIEQAVKNNLKVARSIIRLRHSIAADTELEQAIPRIRARLQAQASAGRVLGLGYEELTELLYGAPAALEEGGE